MTFFGFFTPGRKSDPPGKSAPFFDVLKIHPSRSSGLFGSQNKVNKTRENGPPPFPIF